MNGTKSVKSGINPRFTISRAYLPVSEMFILSLKSRNEYIGTNYNNIMYILKVQIIKYRINELVRPHVVCSEFISCSISKTVSAF